MQDKFILKTTQHWKALGHPLRASILRLLAKQRLTNEQMAEILCVESGKLYFHTKQLLDAGMIRVAETRAKGSVVEKLYQAVARTYVANGLPDEIDSEEPVFSGIILDALWLYRRTWQEFPGIDGKTHHAFHYVHRMSPQRAQEFTQRLLALAAEFQDNLDETTSENLQDASDTMEYSFAALLHALPDKPSGH